MNQLLTYLMAVSLLVLVGALLAGWDRVGERRARRLREVAREEAAVIRADTEAHERRLAIERAKGIPESSVKEAAARLILDMDHQREVMARTDEHWKARDRAQALEIEELRRTVRRLEWLLGLCSYDPITGYLDTYGPTGSRELYRRLGGDQTETAFQARLFDGVKSGLYRVADGEEGRVYWLDPKRPAVVLASDDDTEDVVLQANLLADAMENGKPALSGGGK